MFILIILSLFSVSSLCAPYAEFIARCSLTGREMFDPIIYPGLTNRSHMHDFYGSTFVQPTVNLNNLLSNPDSCSPNLDFSLYWHPTLLDSNNNSISADRITFYYMSRDIDSIGSVRPIPNGLRIVAGNQLNNTVTTPYAHWGCQGEATSGGNIVQCTNALLEAFVEFPECWDGVNLDSPDHRSHMKYSVGSACPASHPIAIPHLQFKIRFPAIGGPGFKLSSGSGYSLHADVIFAWNDQAMLNRINECIHLSKKCGEVLASDSQISQNQTTTTSPLTTGSMTTNRATTGSITTGRATTGSITTGLITTSPMTTSPMTTSPITTSPITTGRSTSTTTTTTGQSCNDVYIDYILSILVKDRITNNIIKVFNHTGSQI